jgi:hypothetical protein
LTFNLPLDLPNKSCWFHSLLVKLGGLWSQFLAILLLGHWQCHCSPSEIIEGTVFSLI